MTSTSLSVNVKSSSCSSLTSKMKQHQSLRRPRNGDDDESFGEKNNIKPNRPVRETGSKRHHPVFRTRNVRLAGRVAIFSQNETNAYD